MTSVWILQLFQELSDWPKGPHMNKLNQINSNINQTSTVTLLMLLTGFVVDKKSKSSRLITYRNKIGSKSGMWFLTWLECFNMRSTLSRTVNNDQPRFAPLHSHMPRCLSEQTGSSSKQYWKIDVYCGIKTNCCSAAGHKIPTANAHLPINQTSSPLRRKVSRASSISQARIWVRGLHKKNSRHTASTEQLESKTTSEWLIA